MSKEWFMAAHDELIEEHMSEWCDKHPDATEAELRAEEALAYDSLADRAHDRMVDKMADLGDRLRMEAKENGR